MAEIKPKLGRVVTFTKNNHRWFRTFDETDYRKEEEPKREDDVKADGDRQVISDNASKNVAFKRSQTIN